MKVVGLISGGKDSIYNLLKCVAYGHEIVALANLYPPPSQSDELDSHMFQTVGHQIVEYIASAMGIPLIRRMLHGKSLITDLHYQPAPSTTMTLPKSTQVDGPTPKDNIINDDTIYDEIDDLYFLLQDVKSAFPDVQGVSCGAILSNYQRIRVESICERIGFTSLAYLWHENQADLLQEMISNHVTAVFVKIATPGLPYEHYLTKSLQYSQTRLLELFTEYNMNVCGEGGEYETLVLDCPLYHSRIHVSEWFIDTNAAVPFATPKTLELINKSEEEMTRDHDMIEKMKHDASAMVKYYSIPHLEDDKKAMLIAPTRVLPPQTSISTSTSTSIPPMTTEKVKTDNIASSLLESSPVLVEQQQRQLMERNISNLGLNTVLCHTFHQSTSTAELFYAICRLGRQFSWRQPVFVHLTIPDMGLFAAVNSEYIKAFANYSPPSRVCVAQSRLGTGSPGDMAYSLWVVWTYRVCSSSTGIPVDKTMNTDEKQQLINKSTPHSPTIPSGLAIQHTHVKSLSQWAPANIGPYSQLWSVNGVHFQAGQIGLISTTHTLPTDPATQLMVTLFNTVQCLRGASTTHAYDGYNIANIYHGVFISLDFYFTEEWFSLGTLEDVIHTVITRIQQVYRLKERGIPSIDDQTDHTNHSQLENKETVSNSTPSSTLLLNWYRTTACLLTLINSTTIIHHKVVQDDYDDDYDFDDNEAETASGDEQTHSLSSPPCLDVMTLLPSCDTSSPVLIDREGESHMYQSSEKQRLFDLYIPPTISRGEQSPSHKYYSLFVPIITNISTDIDQKECQNLPTIIFKTAETLPMRAYCESQGRGLTHSALAKLQNLAGGLKKLRWVLFGQDQHGSSDSNTLYVVVALYHPHCFLDLVIYELVRGTDGCQQENERVNEHQTTQITADNGLCGLSNHVLSSLLDLPQNLYQSCVWSEVLCTPASSYALGQDTDKPSPLSKLSTMASLMNDLIASINTACAYHHINAYLQLLADKQNQFKAIKQAATMISEATPSPNSGHDVASYKQALEDLYLPRPHVTQTAIKAGKGYTPPPLGCLCDVLPSTPPHSTSDSISDTCPRCQLFPSDEQQQQRHLTRYSCASILHQTFILVDPLLNE